MKRQKLLWFLFFYAISITATRAGIDPPPSVGARAVGMGHAYVGVGQNFWSLFHNPAGIAGIENLELGAYFERRFNLSELTYGSAGAVIPFTDNQSVGAEIGSFGFDAYRENHVGLSYAIRVIDKISIGAKLNYANISAPDLGSASAFFVNVGIQTKVNSQITVGVNAYNVNRANINTLGGGEDIPTVLTAGIAYQPTDKVLIVADIQKDIDHPTSFRGGFEYTIIEGLYARMGVSTEPLTINGGLGVKYKNIKLDATFGFHERLGYTPHVSMSYEF